jgi:selenide,water dikinase
VLGDLPVSRDDRVLVDYRTSDDAGVYRLEGDRALVQTVDFFTPIIDDPFAYGQIAAANALSDVYAMGGQPLTALAIAAFPQEVDRSVIRAIFAGGLQKLSEGRVALLGGHTIQDQEIKFGYSVTGEVDANRIWSNAGARPGDVLLLTKPLGTGIIATALKFDRAPAAAVEAAIASMLTLNQAASDVLRRMPPASVHACTDVTGFGLLGHSSEMAAASGVSLSIDAAAVPLLPGAVDLVESHAGNVPGGGRNNRVHFGPGVSVTESVVPAVLTLLFDPQTSGGLLVAVAAAEAERTARALQDEGVAAARVGWVVARAAAPVTVV